jgi:hypothetical protein
MALSRGMAHASVGIGFALLALAFGCVAAGAFAMSKLNAFEASIGLWAIYVSLIVYFVFLHFMSSNFTGGPILPCVINYVISLYK